MIVTDLVLDKWGPGPMGYSNGNVQKVLSRAQNETIDTELIDINILVVVDI